MNITQEGNQQSKEEIIAIPPLELNKYISSTKSNTFNNPYDKTVGGYRITPNIGSNSNEIDFIFYKKPCWFHRMACNLILGWTWIDKKYEK